MLDSNTSITIFCFVDDLTKSFLKKFNLLNEKPNAIHIITQ